MSEFAVTFAVTSLSLSLSCDAILCEVMLGAAVIGNRPSRKLYFSSSPKQEPPLSPVAFTGLGRRYLFCWVGKTARGEYDTDV